MPIQLCAAAQVEVDPVPASGSPTADRNVSVPGLESARTNGYQIADARRWRSALRPKARLIECLLAFDRRPKSNNARQERHSPCVPDVGRP